MRKTIAYYHLPGLFEFYELYEAFLPVYRKHREYFYDWCGIGSIYGAPADCIWGGGRIRTLMLYVVENPLKLRVYSFRKISNLKGLSTYRPIPGREGLSL